MSSPTIRLASPKDAEKWLDLIQACLGSETPFKQAYDPVWIGGQLDSTKGHETWIAEAGGKIEASISFLRPEEAPSNPVSNLGRNLFRAESFKSGSAEALFSKVIQLGSERGNLMVTRIVSSSYEEMRLCEKLGFVCVGFQPLKHIVRSRLGMFFYVHAEPKSLSLRNSVSESLSQVSSLACEVLEQMQIPAPLVVRDGVTGYPLQAGIQIHQASPEDFELFRKQARDRGGPVEVSTGYNRGNGYLRIESPASGLRAIIAQRDSEMTAGICFLFDEQDRCLRIIDSFSNDTTSLGELFQHAVKISQDELSAAYLEVDVLMTASRLLKTADQLGFVPVAYFPAFYSQAGHNLDVVKMVKLNMVYSREEVQLTVQAGEIVKIIDTNFQDQKVGVAVINLLRTLPIFEGLGDGELRKISRLFTQKLYRPGEAIFKQGDSGEEAYIVMRGQVDICIENKSEPIATIDSGQIFGEVAFLDGSSRTAMAVARVPSILLVVRRSAFNELVLREPHLGMVVIRNMAMDLSNKLRRTNTAIFRKS